MHGTGNIHHDDDVLGSRGGSAVPRTKARIVAIAPIQGLRKGRKGKRREGRESNGREREEGRTNGRNEGRNEGRDRGNEEERKDGRDQGNEEGRQEERKRQEEGKMTGQKVELPSLSAPMYK